MKVHLGWQLIGMIVSFWACRLSSRVRRHSFTQKPQQPLPLQRPIILPTVSRCCAFHVPFRLLLLLLQTLKIILTTAYVTFKANQPQNTAHKTNHAADVDNINRAGMERAKAWWSSYTPLSVVSAAARGVTTPVCPNCPGGECNFTSLCSDTIRQIL